MLYKEKINKQKRKYIKRSAIFKTLYDFNVISGKNYYFNVIGGKNNNFSIGSLLELIITYHL